MLEHKSVGWPDLVAHASNPSAGETEAEDSRI